VHACIGLCMFVSMCGCASCVMPLPGLLGLEGILWGALLTRRLGAAALLGCFKPYAMLECVDASTLRLVAHTLRLVSCTRSLEAACAQSTSVP